jgi:hypothetical protein
LKALWRTLRIISSSSEMWMRSLPGIQACSSTDNGNPHGIPVITCDT